MRKLILVILLLASTALADDEQVLLQRMRFVERGDVLTVTTSIGKLFDAEAFQALSSGFPSTVELQIFVFPKDSTDEIAATRILRSVVYDLWDEIYTVRLEGNRTLKVKSPAEALKLLTNVEDLPVAPLSRMPYEDMFFLAMRADLNPVSKQTLTEVRRWLTQGTGGGLDRGGAFFGSFVSVFVNPKIADADRILRLRSQPFYRPKP